MRIYQYFSLLASLLLISACGPNTPVYEKNPIDDIVKNLSEVPNFTIMLYDMNYDESSEKYLHQYRILKEDSFNDTLVAETTDWLQVSASYFNTNVDNMGMTLISKVNGQLEKKVAPPGYNNYVGNEKYGQWREGSNGSSFWEFYGKYAMLQTVFGFGRSPIYYGGWNDYRRNYYPTGRTYYGTTSNGGTRFGTNGTHNTSRSTRSTWNSKPASFKQNVRSKVQRSSSRTNRTSRSSSRYRSSSSSRGRGFGGGK